MEYRNPQNEPGADKRLLFTLLAVFLVIGVMQYLLPKPQQSPQPEKNQQQQAQQPTATPPPAGPAATTTRTPPRTPAVAARVPVKAASSEAESVIDNGFYRITFTNRGAVVKSWRLVAKNNDGSYKYRDNSGKPFDLVNQTMAPQLGYPLSLFFYDKELESKINQAVFVRGSDGEPTGGPLTFEYSDGDVTVRKTFRPEKDHILGVETDVTRNGQRVQAYPQWPSGLGDQQAPASFLASKIDWQQDNDIERKSPTSGGFLSSKKWISGGQTLPGPYNWVAIADQYFAAAFMPDNPKNTTLVTLNSPAEAPKNPEKPNEAKDRANVIGVAVGNPNGPTRARIFAGPRAVDLLESVRSQPDGPDLRGIYDFGTFGLIARPLFLWLKWTYEHWIHNWGWAIAFLTLAITMALLPLRLSSMNWSLRMHG